MSLNDRVQRAAEVLKTDESNIRKALSEHLGVECGNRDAEDLIDVTTDEMVREALHKALGPSAKPAPLMAAVSFLKGRNPFERSELSGQMDGLFGLE